MTDLTYRDLEKRLAELRGDAENVEILVRDEVIATPWEPAPGAEVPSQGTSVTRYYRDGSSKWTAKDGGEYDE